MSTLESPAESQAGVKRAYRAFFSPGRYDVKPSEQEIIQFLAADDQR